MLDRLDTRLTKATRDLVAHKGRSLLVLAGLALSLWGLTTVGTAFWVLWHDLRANFVGTTPPSLILRTTDLDAGQRAAVRDGLAALPEIDAVENRPLVAGRIALGSRWLPVVVSVVEDFDTVRVARFEAADGLWPPPEGSLSIERDGEMLARLMGLRSSGDTGRGHGGDQGHGGARDYGGARNHGVRDHGGDHHGANDAVPHAPRATDEPTRHNPRADAAAIARGERGLQTLGDMPIRLRFGADRAFEVSITGTVFDPGKAPSRMEQMIYGYASRSTVEGWGVGVDTDRWLLTLAGDPESAAAVQAATRAVEDEMARLGVTVDRWTIPDYAHPHAFQMRSVLAVLGALGLLATLLAAVLVHDLVSTLLSDQIRQIGILKALGATAPMVGRTYLLAMMLLGAGAAVVAVPIGLRSGMGLARGVAAFLNFEIVTASAPAWMIASFALVGVVHPAVAALWSVTRTVRITVRDALLRGESQGAPPATESARESRLPPAVAMALRNAFRRRWRWIATVVTLAVGTTAFLAAGNLRASLLYTAEVVETTQRHDLRLMLGTRIDTTSLEQYIRELDGVADVEAWDARAVALRSDRTPSDQPMGVHGMTLLPASTEAIAPRMIRGRWLSPGETDGIVVNQKFLYDRPDLRLGEPATLAVDGRTTEVRIVGVIKEFGPATVYFDDAGFESAFGPDDGQRIVVISLADRSWSARRAMRERLEFAIAHSKLDVRRLLTTTMAAAIIRSHLDVIAYVLLAVAALMMGVSGMGMVSSLAVSVAERRRELGVLRAIGARRSTVRGMLTLEAMLLGGLGWALAVLVSWLVNEPLTGLVGRRLVEYPFDVRIAPEGLIAALGIALAMSIGASWLASRKALNQPVRDALRVD